MRRKGKRASGAAATAAKISITISAQHNNARAKRRHFLLPQHSLKIFQTHNGGMQHIGEKRAPGGVKTARSSARARGMTATIMWRRAQRDNKNGV